MTCSTFGVLLFLGLIATSHSTNPQDPPPAAAGSAGFEGTSWTAVELYGTTVTAKSSAGERDPHLVFGPEGRLSGADGCNRLTGPYTVKANGITFGQIAGTQMFCAEAGDVPNRFRAALKGTSHWSIVNGRLEFYGATGKPLAVFVRRESASGAATLSGTSWQLVRFQGGDDKTLTPDGPAKYTVAFEGSGRLTARIDCNRGSATWRETPSGQLELGPLALTRAMCQEGSLHDHIVKQWPYIRSFVIRDGRLFLSLMADGGTFEFAPVVTAGQGHESSGRTTANPAAHWPRFRGPSSNPVSEHPNLPVRWSKTENVDWVADVPGVGWSSPVVWGNRVFITAATSDKPMKQPALGVDYSNEYLAELRKQGLSSEEINRKLYERDREMPDEIVISLMLYCYDLETGQKLWERQMYKGPPAGGRHSKNSFASETPTTDGERVYVYLTDYGLFAYDFAGKQSWATPLTSHATTRDWGTGASPALHKDRLFVLNDNEEQSFVAAFDTRTGKELWRTPRTVQPARKTGWSTPFVWENRVRTELITLGPAVAISYSLEGRELWRLNRMGGVAIQSPFAWNDLLFVTSGSGGDDNKPIVAVRAGGSGDITPPAAETRSEYVAWYDRLAGGTYLPTPVIYKNALYVLNDKGIFSRHNAETGERTYRSRVAPGASAFTASPWAYNGHVFAMSEEGDTFVIEAADQYRLVRVNSLDDFSMATPAIVGDRLLIRTQHRLYSIRNRQ